MDDNAECEWGKVTEEKSCSRCNCLRVPWAGARGRGEQVAHAQLLGESTASMQLPGKINQAYC